MTSELSTRMRSGQTWLRLALMIIYFFVVYTVVRLLVGISMLFQFVHQLVKGAQAERLHEFTADLNAFSYSVLQYLTFNSDERPFPFCDWPAPNDQDDSSSHY